MKTKLLSELIFISASITALMMLFQVSGSSLYFISIGFYLILAALFFFLSQEKTLQVVVLIMSVIVGLYVAGQFDADFIRIFSTVVVIGLVCYVFGSKLFTYRKKN